VKYIFNFALSGLKSLGHVTQGDVRYAHFTLGFVIFALQAKDKLAIY